MNKAVSPAKRMLNEGADFIDIGGDFFASLGHNLKKLKPNKQYPFIWK